MSSITNFWRKLKNNGCDITTDLIKVKNIIFTNTLLYISFFSYCIFLTSLILNNLLNIKILLISSLFIIVGFISVYFLLKAKQYLLGKSILLLLLYLSIFFFDFSLGESAGVYLYYFAFFLTTFNIFSWSKERVLLLTFLLIPALLLLSTEIYNLANKKSILHEGYNSLSIYIFNSLMTFLIIAINTLQIIKENLLAQQSLSLSKPSAQLLTDIKQGCIWSIDMNYKLIAFSKLYKEIIKKQYNIDCYEGLDINKVFNHPNYPLEILAVYKKVLQGKTAVSEYFSNNNYFEIEGSPLYSADGTQIAATFYSRLITARKTNEQELQQAKINLETLIDSAGNSTWSLTTDYKIIAANKMYVSDMKRIFDVNIHPGFDLSQLFDKPNFPKDWKGQYDLVFSGQNLFLDHIFAEDFFELNAVPIRNIRNEIIGAVFFSRNISERKFIEQELTKAKTNAEQATVAKAQFLSNMSHELRTPLNGIIGLTNLLLSEQYLPAQTQHLEVLKYSSDHMLTLINDVLDFNKIEAGKVDLEKSAFNLLEVVEKMETFFSWEAAGKGLSFEVNLHNNLHRIIEGDVTRLRQILTNLISNAIKFTETGSVGFSIEILEQLSEGSCKLRFCVTDTGIGIEEDKLAQIFDSFGQADPSTIRKYGGSGLGLTISKKLIELMGSRLQVKSLINKGSVFWFDLIVNCSLQKQVDVKVKEINQLSNLSGIQILIAEDNPVNMMVVSKMLEKWNVIVTKAKNGKEALDLALNNKYSLILMDLQMPEMDGFTATAEIRAAKLTLPIIALTATTDDTMLKNIKQKGMNGLVQKPFIPEELHKMIADMISAN